jgi:hypothetical protein
MKIIFLCGSLEHGKDGVGDYTRRLAGELIRQGHNTAIISLNDQYIDNVVRKEQESEGANISIMRLPSGLSNHEKYNNAGNYINDFNPEWLSLQYVPYSFQKKGLPFGLAKRLAKIGKGRKWHIMFHEMWVGAYYAESIKTILIRYMQIRVFVRLINQLNPKLINTQSSLYKTRIEELGYGVQLLPLFGNIPVYNINGKTENTNRNEYTLIVFGGIHPNIFFPLFVKELKKIQEEEGYLFNINFIGRNGDELKNWTKILEKANINYHIYGEMNIIDISKLLLQADIGITSNPPIYAEKSGTVASMIEHGLKVICVANAPHINDLESIYNPMNLYIFKNNIEHDFFSHNKEKTLRTHTLMEIATQLVKYISEL